MLLRRLVPALLLAMPALAAEPSFTIRPVQMITQAEVPEGAPDDAKSVMFNKGFTIGYLVEGEDIIGFDDESLAIESILLPGGKDIAKKRNGEPNWKFGSFPKASPDGKYGYFQVESEEHLFGRAESAKLRGSLTILTGSQLVTVTSKPHALTAKESEKVGDFDVTFGQAAGSDVAAAMFAKTGTIAVSGGLGRITSFKLLVDGKEVDGEGSMSSKGSNTRIYMFGAAAAKATGTVEIKYWKNYAEHKVAFGG